MNTDTLRDDLKVVEGAARMVDRGKRVRGFAENGNGGGMGKRYKNGNYEGGRNNNAVRNKVRMVMEERGGGVVYMKGSVDEGENDSRVDKDGNLVWSVLIQHVSTEETSGRSWIKGVRESEAVKDVVGRWLRERVQDEGWKRNLRKEGKVKGFVEGGEETAKATPRFRVLLPTHCLKAGGVKYVEVTIDDSVKEALEKAGNKVREGVKVYLVEKGEGGGEYDR